MIGFVEFQGSKTQMASCSSLKSPYPWHTCYWWFFVKQNVSIWTCFLSFAYPFSEWHTVSTVRNNVGQVASFIMISALQYVGMLFWLMLQPVTWAHYTSLFLVRSKNLECWSFPVNAQTRSTRKLCFCVWQGESCDIISLSIQQIIMPPDLGVFECCAKVQHSKITCNSSCYV